MEGSCHCGNIQFKTEGDPFWVGACYCTDCQKVSGAPYLVFASFNGVTYTKGVPQEYASSEKVIRTFCGQCGAAVSFAYRETPENVFLCAGLFDNAETLVPQKHIFTEHKLPWLP